MVFIGAEDVRAGLQDELDGVVILEVKTGGSDLNKVQRRIRDAVVNGDVEFALYNADDKTIRVWSPRDPKGKDVRQQS
jgi:predicted Holliday junction resolvase-like endonuclease